METINQIICVGNSTVETDRWAKQIADEYNLPYLGRLKNLSDNKQGCACVTILHDLSLAQWHDVAKKTDLIVCLDQSMESFSNLESWYKTQTGCRWYSNFKTVIFQNQNCDLWLTKNILPIRKFNTQQVRISTNQEVVEEIFKHDLTNRFVILEFLKLDNANLLSNFLSDIDRTITHCRNAKAKVVVFRASEHEEDEIHYKITYHLCQYPEFLLLNPQHFKGNLNQNLNTALNQHRNILYHKKYEPIQV